MNGQIQNNSPIQSNHINPRGKNLRRRLTYFSFLFRCEPNSYNTYLTWTVGITNPRTLVTQIEHRLVNRALQPGFSLPFSFFFFLFSFFFRGRREGKGGCMARWVVRGERGKGEVMGIDPP